LLPDAFISATEQNRLIVPLTEWVLQEAATQLLRWASAGLGEHKVAVNISPILLRLQGFIDLFDRCMTRTRCDPRNLVIEITEGTLVDEAKAIPVLTALQKQGVTIAIDDFGMGYSSMVRLKTLPVDVLKVDRSFLANVTEDVSDASIVESLVSVGHSLGKKVVAEGVETVEQLSFLKSAGCDVAQGFFINRPMPAADIVPWLEQWQLPELCCVNRQDLCLSKT
jgi:EAL domain-containing protein (putative c-di-GMP-specific phosphodiesterase class I)